MNCEQCETLLMAAGPLTDDEATRLRTHAASCPECAEVLECIELTHRGVKAVVPAEPLHAAGLTHKVMQALPPQQAGFSLGIIPLLRIGFAASTLVLFLWLGSELLIEKTFLKPAAEGGPRLNSAAYIAHPLEEKTKTISLKERIKEKGYE